MRSNRWNWLIVIGTFATALTVFSCGDSDTGTDDNEPSQDDFIELLTNQIDHVIIPTMQEYQSQMITLQTTVQALTTSVTDVNVQAFSEAYTQAYLAYQAVAVHDYFDTQTAGLVMNTNLYPIDIEILDALISEPSYDFSTTKHIRANGFPVLDYYIYGLPDGLQTYLSADHLRLQFLIELVESMKDRADLLVQEWTGDIRENFINNGGTALGSSISVQLNNSIIYCEEHIRENKVGIPIGLVGPNDSPIEPDGTKIEGYYQSLAEGNASFALELVRASMEELEDLYLGTSKDGIDGQGYDDMMAVREQAEVDIDVKAQFQAIYTSIDQRSEIMGDDDLYQRIQGLITLYKTDLFPILNVQDADGATDGD